MTFDNYFYTAYGARIIRNVIDFKKEFEYNHKRDMFILYTLLDRGYIYFHDEIMSVYEFTGRGIFSSLHFLERCYSRLLTYYISNKYLNYRHDDFFTKEVDSKRLVICKKFFGRELGWRIYIFFKRRKYLKKLYKEKIDKFKFIEDGHKLYTKKEYQQILELAKGQE